ncbi:MAG: hypothetical protein HY653_07365 [Acidobacteria bacterium]|nr:hypothetical protein [Acidobacteriota bacterium]
MGRTVPTFRQLIEEEAQRWLKFRRALYREDQAYFDRVFQRVRLYTEAATYQCHANPLEAILLAVAIDQEKRLYALEQLLRQKGLLDADRRLALRPLPEPAGDDAVGDRAEPEAPPAD